MAHGKGPMSFFVCEDPTVPTPFAEKTSLSLLIHPGNIVKNQLTIYVRIYLCIINSVPLILCQYQTTLISETIKQVST